MFLVIQFGHWPEFDIRFYVHISSTIKDWKESWHLHNCAKVAIPTKYAFRHICKCWSAIGVFNECNNACWLYSRHNTSSCIEPSWTMLTCINYRWNLHPTRISEAGECFKEWYRLSINGICDILIKHTHKHTYMACYLYIHTTHFTFF